MHIVCPNCSTRYRVDAGAIGREGRTVRCSRCGHRWFVALEIEAPEAEAPEEETLEDEAFEAPREPASAPLPPRRPEALPVTVDRHTQMLPPVTEEPRRFRPAAIAAGAGLVLLILALVVLVLARHQIVAAVPALRPVFETVGLTVERSSGFELRDLAVTRKDENGKIVLVVTGRLTNVSSREQSLPPLRVALLDDDRNEIDFDLFDIGQERLPPGASTPFEVKVVDPSPQARSFRVTLAETS
jgi:predicted Zn finger-like uncharacterized protein